MMTMIVACRDPFWLVSDGLESDLVKGGTYASGAKIKAIPSSGLAIGIAGVGSLLDALVADVQSVLDKTPTWHALENATRSIVNDINARPEIPGMGISAVVAGTLAGVQDIFAWGPEAELAGAVGTSLGRHVAVAGTGGLRANVGRTLTSRYCPEVTGEDLLTTMVEVAIQTDEGRSGNPIWRIDLGGDSLAPAYVWLSVIPEPTR
jgi:hypothetical protein